MKLSAFSAVGLLIFCSMCASLAFAWRQAQPFVDRWQAEALAAQTRVDDGYADFSPCGMFDDFARGEYTFLYQSQDGNSRHDIEVKRIDGNWQVTKRSDCKPWQ